MNEQQLILNVFAKYFNKTDTELTELLYDKGEDEVLALKDDASTVLIDMDAEKVKRIRAESKGDPTKKFDEGYNKAKKEVLEKFEKDVRDKFGMDSDKRGLDLIAEFGESMNSGNKITLEKIKTNPEFLKLEKEMNDNFKVQIEELKGEFDTFKNGVEKGKSVSLVKDRAELAFLKLNPVLSEDTARSKKQTEMFLSRFEGFDYEFVDGNIVIKDGDSRLEDGHGNPIVFDAFVKSEAESLFDFKVQDPKKAPGNKSDGGGDPTKSILPKKDYNKMVNDAEGDMEKLVEIGSKYTYAEE